MTSIVHLVKNFEASFKNSETSSNLPSLQSAKALPEKAE